MDRTVIATGNTRTRTFKVPAIRIGQAFGEARTAEEIPRIAEIVGRPAGAFIKVVHEEEVKVYQGGSVQTMWRTTGEEFHDFDQGAVDV